MIMLGLSENKDTLTQLNDVLSQFDETTQEALLKELKKALIISKAKALDARIKTQGIKVSDAQIMAICIKARKEIHAA